MASTATARRGETGAVISQLENAARSRSTTARGGS
jgi:hypothetical protein